MKLESWGGKNKRKMQNKKKIRNYRKAQNFKSERRRTCNVIS